MKQQRSTKLTAALVTEMIGQRQIHVERNPLSPGEWVVDATSVWTVDDLRRVLKCQG